MHFKKPNWPEWVNLFNFCNWAIYKKTHQSPFLGFTMHPFSFMSILLWTTSLVDWTTSLRAYMKNWGPIRESFPCWTWDRQICRIFLLILYGRLSKLFFHYIKLELCRGIYSKKNIYKVLIILHSLFKILVLIHHVEYIIIYVEIEA